MNNTPEQILESMVANDAVYQDLLHDCLALEPEFLRIRASLPSCEQEILDRYIALCEELDHRRLTFPLTI